MQNNNITATESGMLYDRHHAAAVLGVSLSFFDAKICKQIARIQIGRRVLYSREALDAYLRQHTIAPTDGGTK